jgi:hypothetical protein
MITYTLCANGCGARANGFLICYECAMKEPSAKFEQARCERVASLRRLATSARPAARSCLTCVHWIERDCGLGIPECGPTFAPTCSCYMRAP